MSSHEGKKRGGGTVKIDGYTRGKAIKLFCTECCGWESLPKDCGIKTCPLYPYRGRSLASK